MPDFAIDPPVPHDPASALFHRTGFDVPPSIRGVTRIKTLQLRRMLKGVDSEGGVRLTIRALKSWLKKRDLLLEGVARYALSKHVYLNTT